MSGAICTMSGSSPHTRGAPPLRPLHWRRAGIIPAYAGSTKIAQKGKGMAADHPRIRGEHAPLMATCRSSPGSSPHTRGALARPHRRHTDARIIPAYAGSTPRRTAPDWKPRDHPRIRGEHPLGVGDPLVDLGSSPHTRGALLRGDGLRGVPGIIPAYAGSTSATWSTL